MIRIFCCILLSSILLGCGSVPLKAPCDIHAIQCGSKTKINTW